MRFLTERFLAQFTEEAASRGWEIDLVDDDEYASFSRPSGSDLRSDLGLDLTPRSYGLSLNPSLGVRHVEVSELTARFFGLPEGASQFGASLTDLVYAAGGGGVLWTVETVEEISLVVQTVLADVETYGGPFFAPYESLRDINRKLERTAKMNFDLAHLAVGYAIADDYSKVQSVLVRLQGWMAQQPPFVVEQTEQFVSAFRAHFDITAT